MISYAQNAQNYFMYKSGIHLIKEGKILLLIEILVVELFK